MINCSVEKCAHNDNFECAAEFIEIQGRGAACEEETFCSAFLPKDVYSSLTESVFSDGACRRLLCDVKSCSHNESFGCALSKIDVGTNDAASCQATQCMSFEQR
jgi:hypothetical protein